MSTPLLLEVAPEIDANQTSFYRGRGRGSAPGLRWGLRLQTPVIGSRSALAMSVHTFRPGDAPPVNAIYRVAQNKIPHRRICNISATGGLILKILEAA